MRNLLFTALFSLFLVSTQAQVTPIHPTDILQGTYYGVSKPLRDIPAMTADEFHQMELKGLTRTLNKDLKNRIFPFSATALPKGPDPAWQDFMGKTYGNRSPLVNFDGQTSPYFPPDCNGTIGPNHFMQTINTVYAIYDKTGTLVAGPTNLNLLFGNVPGANRNDGDPIILYDEQADRWVVTEFSIPFSGPNYILFAVSTTNDPTGTWHQYSFQVASMPDYPKFSVWRDGYYMGDNNSGGNDIYVFERTPMLSGQPAQSVGFNNAWRPTSVDGFMCVPPIDNDGTFAPAGTPGMFIAFNDDALGGGTDELWLYDLTVDWTTPASSTFVRTLQLPVQPFNSNFGNNWNNIEQKGTNQRVDGIPQVIMNVPQYRNFGTHQTIVCCHTVNIDGVRHAGIRWYELRKTGSAWVVRQQGTYAPDEHSRWMGSVVINGSNEIAMGYSVSSTTIFPGILFCGQSAGENSNATGILDLTEDTIQVGAYSQTGANRWGDYAQISIDPTDDKTFWFTTQYVGSGGSRKTKIASWRYAFQPIVATLPATSVATTTATLNGTVNPNGQETTYHFEYGLTPIALTNSTPAISAGSGTAIVNVTDDVAGLAEGTIYYYRIVAESTGGSASGLKVKFTTALAPFMNVTPAHQNVASSFGTTMFEVSSNVDWTVVCDASWCAVTASGSGSDTIFISVEENLLAATRTAQVTVSGTGVPSQVVTVTQDGALATLSVNPPTAIVAASGGSFKYDVTSNTLWTVVCDQTWCTVTPGGSLNDTITATCVINLSITARQCNIQVSAPGIPPVTVTLLQEGAPLMLSVTPNNQNVAATAGNTTFQVSSNTDWIVLSDMTWCTVTAAGSGNGTILADYAQNTGDQPRVASISVSASGLPVQTVTVAQAKSSIGVDDLEKNGIQVYPNPTKGLFVIVPVKGYTGTLDVTVQDMAGRVLVSKTFKGEKEYQVDLSTAAEGTYQLVLKTDHGPTVRKIVVLK